MKAEIIAETGSELYFAIKIEGLSNIRKPSIILRTAICDYNNHDEMVKIFNEIIGRINEGENK